MAIMGVCYRPEDGKMHEAVDLARGGLVFSPPQLGQPLIVHTTEGESTIINLGRVVECGFEDGSGRSFYATTHRMSGMNERRYKAVHIMLDASIPALKAWNA